MKMKRMFSKKKKTTNKNNVIYDQNPMDSIEESSIIRNPHENQSGPKPKSRKKQRQRKKRKSQAKGNTNVENDLAKSEIAPVVCHVTDNSGLGVRRSSGLLEDRVIQENYVNKEKRIPGSESSSRTASSASSSSTSSRTWSNRPWSLVEPQRGQSMLDLTKTDSSDYSFDLNKSADNHNITVPTICTLPRGAYLEEEKYGKNSRNRTFTLDFNFFRRFKRSSTSTNVANSKRLSTSQLSLSWLPDERESFSIRNLRKGRKSKKVKDENLPNRSVLDSCDQSPQNITDTVPDRRSGRLNSVQESILEEALSSPSKPSCSETSSSKASVTTVISATDLSISNRVIKRSSVSQNVENRYSFGGFDNENVDPSKYEDSQHKQAIARRSICGPMSTSNSLSMVPLSKTRSANTSSDLDSSNPCFTPPKIRVCHSLTNFEENMSLAPASNYGGSMKNVCFGPDSSSSSKLGKKKRNSSKFSILAPKGSFPYSSTPHVNISSPESLDSSLQRSKASSVKQRLPDARKKSQTSLAPLSLFHVQSKTTESADSTKRESVFPDVVLRRHHNRLSKKNDDSSSEWSNSHLMSRDNRDLHAMSLNVEDLPTYELMKNEPRWRRSSTLQQGHGHSFAKVSYSDLTKEDLLKQLHSTSVDDLRELDLLPHNLTMEALNDMDDDEYLNLSLALNAAKDASDRERRKSTLQEAPSKRGRNLKKSLASLISSGKPGKKLQRSSSFKESSGSEKKPSRPSVVNNTNGGTAVLAAYRPPGKRGKSKNATNRHSKLWSETFDHSGLEELELKRQEAIYELYQGECVMVEDLKMAKKTYRDSMMTLKMLTEDEVNRIFGKLDCLLPLHEDLLSRLEKTRTENGRTDGVGEVFIEWFPSLSPYDEYCANQADAKETLDAVVERESRVRDFLQRCLESPFSRKLDLWSYLDLPRSRLVKYPLLLKAIHKVTPPSHPDFPRLSEAIDVINDIIARVDNLTGERQAEFVKSKLEYLDEKQKCPEVEISRKIICSGQLKNTRGSKLQVFLFDQALVLTRNATRGDRFTYQVYRQPVALKSLVIETEEGGKLSGSFRGGILSGDKAKHSFRVKSESASVSYTLIATDEHDKKQWVNSIQEGINNCRSEFDQSTSLPTAAVTPVPTRRRSGSAKLPLKTSPVDFLEKTKSVKRTSSVKSDSGSVTSWYRNRTFTSLSRRESKDNGEIDDLTKSSPLFHRRSKSSLLGFLSGTNVPERKQSPEEKSDSSQSRSLTSSPIAFLSNLPKRKQRLGSGLSRSESCYTKPPSGRISSLTQSFRLSRSQAKSSAIPITRSIPDLTAYERGRSSSLHSLTLEAIRSPLVLGSADSGETLSESLKEEVASVLSSPEQSKTPKTGSPSNSCLNLASPSHNSSKLSIQSTFPDMDYQICITSTPIHHSRKDELNSTRNMLERTSSISSSRSSSSTSLVADPSPIDDVEEILDKAGSEVASNDCEATPTNQPINSRDDVALTLNEILNRVCELNSVHSILDPHHVTVSCTSDFIALTTDNGQAWSGNDLEVTV